MKKLILITMLLMVSIVSASLLDYQPNLSKFTNEIQTNLNTNDKIENIETIKEYIDHVVIKFDLKEKKNVKVYMERTRFLEEVS